MLYDLPYPYTGQPLGYSPMRLSDFTKLPLMKRIVLVDPSGDLVTTEIRRCPHTGLTLKHTTRS